MYVDDAVEKPSRNLVSYRIVGIIFKAFSLRFLSFSYDCASFIFDSEREYWLLWPLHTKGRVFIICPLPKPHCLSSSGVYFQSRKEAKIIKET